MAFKLTRELESDVDDTFPVNRAAGVIDGWLEASSLYGTDGSFTQTMAKIACDPDDLDVAGG